MHTLYSHSMEKKIQTYLQESNPKKIFILIGPSRSGKSYVCNKVINEYVKNHTFKLIHIDTYDNIDYESIQSQLSCNSIYEYFTIKRKTTYHIHKYIVYIDSLESLESPKKILDSLVKLKTENKNLYILVNTSNTIIVDKNSIYSKHYLNAVHSLKTTPTLHTEFQCKADAFYDVPFKTIQLLFYCWKNKKNNPRKMNSIMNTDMYVCEPNQISGFIFDEYVKLTNSIESIVNISDTLSCLGIFETYRESYSLHRLIEYLYIFGLSSLFTSKINTSYTLKHFYPIYNIKMIKRQTSTHILKHNRLDILSIHDIISICSIYDTDIYTILIPWYFKDIQDYNSILKLFGKKEIKINTTMTLKKKHDVYKKKQKNIYKKKQQDIHPKKQHDRIVKVSKDGKKFKIVKQIENKKSNHTSTNSTINNYTVSKDTIHSYTMKQLIQYCREHRIKKYSTYTLKKDLLQFILEHIK